ncbi:MAG: YadA C-terminal domain-containing protein [Verrucomicrobiae bacterium]|nr:YadA C-terminal domain-containing protein [Verrucomicrobiae bacterium]NNJ42614.1 YadA C-terminal domain-containing protein [Akkermansiaceae bacterium]
MITKQKLMAAAFACAVTPVAYAADLDAVGALGGVTGDTVVVDGNARVGNITSSNTTAGAENNLTGNIPVPGAPLNTEFNVTKEYSRVDTVDTTGNTFIDADGNLTLTAGTSTTQGTATGTVGADVFLAAKYDVYPDDDPQEGLPIPGTSEYVLVEADPASPGDYIEVAVAGGPFANAGDLETALNGLTPVDYAALGLAAHSVDPATTTGGNLQVGGDANVDGVLSVGDSGAGGVADVDAAINGNAAAIAQEVLDRAAGDAATLVSANTYTDTEVAAEAVLRAAGDAATLVSANTYTDTEVAAEAALRVAGDAFLQNQVSNNAGAIANNSSRIASNKRDIQTNTRGIAMVAAMTNTTVLPGNTQAVDFNLSHFEGETGFGFGYARAINPNLQLKISVASTTDFDESVVRAGVSYQW